MARPDGVSFAKDCGWRLEALALDLLSAALRPWPVSWGVGPRRGGCCGGLGPLTAYHRLAERNLRLAFPAIDAATCTRLLRDQWDNVGADLLRVPADRPAYACGRTRGGRRHGAAAGAGPKTRRRGAGLRSFRQLRGDGGGDRRERARLPRHLSRRQQPLCRPAHHRHPRALRRDAVRAQGRGRLTRPAEEPAGRPIGLVHERPEVQRRGSRRPSSAVRCILPARPPGWRSASAGSSTRCPCNACPAPAFA